MREFRFFSAIPRGDNKRVTGFKNENEKLDGQLAIGRASWPGEIA